MPTIWISMRQPMLSHKIEMNTKRRGPIDSSRSPRCSFLFLSHINNLSKNMKKITRYIINKSINAPLFIFFFLTRIRCRVVRAPTLKWPVVGAPSAEANCGAVAQRALPWNQLFCNRNPNYFPVDRSSLWFQLALKVDLKKNIEW